MTPKTLIFCRFLKFDYCRVIRFGPMENRGKGDSQEVEMATDATAMTTEESFTPVVPGTVVDQSFAMDLDSQPLNDLGVSVMDQDVLERNVAAQVCTKTCSF